jgi:hypothetical protein
MRDKVLMIFDLSRKNYVIKHFMKKWNKLIKHYYYFK